MDRWLGFNGMLSRTEDKLKDRNYTN